MPKRTTKSGEPNEAAIRDFLEDRLDLIEPGLKLLGVEVQLPSPNGSPGFLDIFAEDAHGRLVIIEIKRTRSAAREALQELFKYVALIRTNRLLLTTDYRVILLSVDWAGLLDAYSEFLPHAPFAVSAGRIVLGSNGLPVRIESVSAPPPPATRRIAVRHFLWGFVDLETADAAATWLGAHFRGLGLADFILVRSRPVDPKWGGEYFLYFGQQELLFDAYYALLKVALDKDALKEFDENIADLPELEDRVAEAADAIWAARGTPGRGQIKSVQMEIAYPEKAREWFKNIAQTEVHFHRFGRFEDPWLTDEVILADLIGETGTSDYRLDFIAHAGRPQEFQELKQRVENVFFFNTDWQGGVLQLLRYVERRGDAQVKVTAFSNEDVLRSVAGMMMGLPIFMPWVRVDIDHSGGTESFIGAFEWDGSSFDFDQMVNDRFSGDFFNYFTGHTLGSNRTLNSNLMADLGLRYGMFRMRPGGPERFRVQGTTVAPAAGVAPRFIVEFLKANEATAESLAEAFMSTDQGFQKLIITAAETLRATALVDALAAEHPRTDTVYWSGEITHCDLCQTSFDGQKYMLDASLGRGAANMCAICFVSHEGRLGQGRGQAYRKDAKGWRIVGG